MKRKSIITRVLVINLCIALVIVAFVAFNNVFMISKIRRQNKDNVKNDIQSIRKNIYSEIERIKNTGAVVLTYENRDSRYAAVNQIIQSIKLSSISYPYSIYVNVFLKDSKTAVNDEGTYHPEIFGDILYRRYGERPEKYKETQEIEISDNYFIINYQNQALGSVSTVVPKKEFIQYIFGKNSNVKYSVTLRDGRELLSDISEKEDKSDYFTVRVSDNNFMGEQVIAYVPHDAMNDELRGMNFYAGIIIFLFIVLSLLAALMQYKIYVPIKKIADNISGSRFGHHDEIALINSAVNALKADNSAMQAEIERARVVYEMQVMVRILTGEAAGDEETLRSLQERYSTYHVLCVVYEGAEGERQLYSLVPDAERLFFSRGIYVYVTTSDIDSSKFENIPAIAVIGNEEHDIMQLKNSYLYVLHTLNCTAVEKFSSCKLQRVSEGIEKTNFHLSIEHEQQITNRTMNGAVQSLEELLTVLYSQKLCKISRSCCIKVCEQLRNLLNSIMMIKKIEYKEEVDAENPADIEKVYKKIVRDYLCVAQLCEAQTPDLSQRACMYIEKNYTDYDLSLTSIAQYCGITAEYLSNMFKKSTGMNISAYIMRKRMEQAKQLLINKKNMRISDIASSVGIENVNTFTRQFKGYAGISPQRFRNSADNDENLCE